jgi:hypothetical protein
MKRLDKESYLIILKENFPVAVLIGPRACYPAKGLGKLIRLLADASFRQFAPA